MVIRIIHRTTEPNGHNKLMVDFDKSKNFLRVLLATLSLFILNVEMAQSADFSAPGSGLETLQLGDQLTKRKLEQKLRRIGFIKGAGRNEDWRNGIGGIEVATFYKGGSQMPEGVAIISIYQSAGQSFIIYGVHGIFFGQAAIAQVSFEAYKHLHSLHTVGKRTNSRYTGQRASLGITYDVRRNGIKNMGVHISISKERGGVINWARFNKQYCHKNFKGRFARHFDLSCD